jgi:hypothetical protein
MIRALPALLAATVLGLAAPPALADATATVRALMADVTGRPVRQIRTATPARVVAVAATERAVLRSVAIAVEAPRVSLRPLARPLTLMHRYDGCSANRLAFAGAAALVGPEASVCARPLEGFAPRALLTLPAAAPGQMVIVTDGRVRVQTLR